MHSVRLHILRTARLVRDDGLFLAIKFAFNVATHASTRRRVLQMRRVFRKSERHLAAIALVVSKASEEC